MLCYSNINFTICGQVLDLSGVTSVARTRLLHVPKCSDSHEVVLDISAFLDGTCVAKIFVGSLVQMLKSSIGLQRLFLCFLRLFLFLLSLYLCIKCSSSFSFLCISLLSLLL